MKDPKRLLISPNSISKEFSDLIESSTEGLKKYYLIMTALEIELFERVTTPKTSQKIAQELGNYHEAMVQMFCEALTEIGVLKKLKGKYVNSSMASTYLCRSSPYYMEYTLKNIRTNIVHWTQLSDTLKNGPIIQSKQDVFGENWLISIAEWSENGAVANALKVITAHLDPKHLKRLLDLGGGHGLYSIAFTALNPQLEAYVFDLPQVEPITRKYVEAYNAKRVHILSGDFYKDSIGQNYDAIFSSYNQSCSDPTLIAKMVQALAPGGYIILRRFKDSSREGALKILGWNLVGFEGKKIGSKPHSSGTIIDKEKYLNHLENAGLTLLGTFSVDDASEITFARKTVDKGSVK